MEEKDKVDIRGNLFSLNIIDDKTNDFYNYDFENNEEDTIEIEKDKTSYQNKTLMNNNILNSLNISLNMKEEEESSDNETYNELFNEIPLEKMIDISNYIIKFYEKKLNLNGTIIRCFHDDIEEKKCFCIPIIIKTLEGMKLSCDNKNFRDLKTINIIELILNNKLFVKNINGICEKDNSINNKPKNEMNENKIEIRFVKRKFSGIKLIQKKAHNKYLKYDKLIKKAINSYKTNILNINNENQKTEIQRKIRNCFFNLLRYINKFIYCLIIKKLIKESLGKLDGDKNQENLKINLEKAIKEFNLYKLKDKDESYIKSETLMISKSLADFQGKKYKLRWIIPFYIKEEIKNNIDKNIFIAISSNGYIFLYLLNIAFNLYPNDNSQYKIITMKDLGLLKNQEKIIKLKNLINSSNTDAKNNYFLISSYHEGKAVIININEKTEIHLEEKYKIEIFQIIKIDFGLYSSIEIEHYGKYYLLNYNNNFNKWIYNENINQIEYKEIKVNKLTNDNDFGKRSYLGPLIQGQKKNLIIAQITFPIQRIEVFNIDESNEDLFLIQKGYIYLNEEDNYFSRQNNNYFLYEDKYLLIASIENKNTKRKGGIYIFDIEKFTKINYIQYNNIISINCFLGVNKNTLICSTETIFKKKSYRNKEGALYLLNIEEKNNSLKLNLKEDKITNGEYKYIDCENFIYESYFSSSSMKNNCIIRINEKYEFIHYFNIYDRDNLKKRLYYFNIDSNC